MASISPARDVNADYIAYGHSMCVDPWGALIAESDEKEDIIYAEIGGGLLPVCMYIFICRYICSIWANLHCPFTPFYWYSILYMVIFVLKGT